MKNRHPLVVELLKYGKQKTWFEYAEQFSIRKGASAKARATSANDIWRAYVSSEKSDMRITKKTVKDDDTYITYKSYEIEADLPEEGLELVKVWRTPEGKIGRSYKKLDTYGIDPGILSNISINLNTIVQKADKGEEIITVYLSDIHAGALVKTMELTRNTPDYNFNVLENYISKVVAILSEKVYKEIHLVIASDLIESFSGKNHNDSWKAIQGYGGEIVVYIYNLIKNLVQSLTNVKCLYLIEGNHDRFEEKKESNSRKGIVEIVAHFLSEAGISVKYHPFMLQEEIDNLFHIIIHGDYPTIKGYDTFLFKNGKQSIFNLIMTGHLHEFRVMRFEHNYAHIQCPSLFTGNFFSESHGYTNAPGFLTIQNKDGKPKIEFIPL